MPFLISVFVQEWYWMDIYFYFIIFFVIAASFAVGDPNVGLDTIGKQCIQTQDPELVRTTVTNENLSGFN